MSGSCLHVSCFRWQGYLSHAASHPVCSPVYVYIFLGRAKRQEGLLTGRTIAGSSSEHKYEGYLSPPFGHTMAGVSVKPDTPFKREVISRFKILRYPQSIGTPSKNISILSRRPSTSLYTPDRPPI